MNPSRVMGTFIRTWREQWAGLTRAQLALAVSTVGEPRLPVASHVVAAWERGQPPKTTAELTALLQVMRRHGLQEPELAEFRSVALAACAGRQYAELFPEDTLRDPDLLAAAAAEMYGHRTYPQQRGPLPELVALTAAVAEMVRTGVQGGRGQRAQAVALCQLLCTVAHHHWHYGRRAPQAAAAGACAAALYEHFGLAGLGGTLTPLLQWSVQAHALAHIPGAAAVRAAARLRDLHARALAQGRSREAAELFCQMADAVGELHPGAYPLLAGESRHSRDLLTDPSDLPNRLAWVSAAEVRAREAEEHIAEWVRLSRHERCPYGVALVRGWVALGQGGYDEARQQFEFAAAEASRLSCPTTMAREFLTLCAHAAAARQPLSYREYRLGAVPRAWRAAE